MLVRTDIHPPVAELHLAPRFALVDIDGLTPSQRAVLFGEEEPAADESPEEPAVADGETQLTESESPEEPADVKDENATR